MCHQKLDTIEIKTGDKNDCNPRAFLPSPVRKTETFLVFYLYMPTCLHAKPDPTNLKV